MACVACAALVIGGLRAWAGGAAIGSVVALANFWLLSRAVLRIGGLAPEGVPRAGHLRAALQGTVLRLVLAGAALALALSYLPIHPLGVAAGLVGVHLGMAVIWTTASLSGISKS